MDKTTGIEGVGTEGSYHLDKSDKELSVSHLKDRLEYNLRHAEEHLMKAKDPCERLHNAGEEPNIPKSLLDLVDYFKQKSQSSPQERANNKLNKHIRENY